MGFRNLLLLLLVLGLSYPFVVVNSQDPLDVASSLSYSHAKGEGYYVVYPGMGQRDVLAAIGTQGNILLVEPSGKNMVAALKPGLESAGNSVELIAGTGTDLNLELAQRSGTRKFIVTDSAYGYNIVVLIPYARASGSYIIFSDKENSGSVSSFLAQASPEKILLYGSLDEEATASIQAASQNTETINTGDKYDDNMRILDRFYSSGSPYRTILLADGTFLEESINIGTAPVALVSPVIPDRMYSYLLEKVQAGQIGSATLIGTSNVNPVYDMMKQMESDLGEKKFSVFVKFGQATATSGEEPLPLSTFPLPYPDAVVSLISASYNPSSGSMEVIFRNSGNANAFVQSNILVLLDGSQIAAISDAEPYIIRRGETKGARYPLQPPGEGQLSINDTTLYGISILSPDKGFVAYLDVGRLSFVDQSSMMLSDAAYYPLDDKLTVKVRNNGDKDTFYRLTVAYVNDEGLTIYEEEQVRNLSSGRNEIVTLTGVVQLPSGEAEGTTMNVTATYGAREAFLEKQAAADVKIDSFPWMMLLVLLLAILILIIGYWYYRKKKEKKEEPKEEVAQKKKKAK